MNKSSTSALRLILLVYAIFIFSAGPASGFCFNEAGTLFDIPPKLLQAIAKVESNYNPVAVHWNSNGSYDYGLMQINSWWASPSRLGEDVWSTISDPCTNVMVGAGILANLIERHGYVWKSVGYYNSGNNKRQKRYIDRVYRAMREIRE